MHLLAAFIAYYTEACGSTSTVIPVGCWLFFGHSKILIAASLSPLYQIVLSVSFQMMNFNGILPIVFKLVNLLRRIFLPLPANCQDYLPAHSTNKHKQTRHSKQKVRQSRWRKDCGQRDGGGKLLFHPLRSLAYNWLKKVYVIVYFQTNAIKNILGNALILYSRIKPRLEIRTKRLDMYM
jgi:hypothetical protein